MGKNRQSIATLMAYCPLAALFAVELYIKKFDGWGAWASAPLLLVPAILGIPIGLSFLLYAIQAYRGTRTVSRHIWQMILAISPLGWLMVRRFLI
jgi:hypothetical protein